VPVSPRAEEGSPVYNPGAHLQPAKNTVAAVQREGDAMALAQALHQKKFPALVITPNADKYFRVQVGSYADTQSPANARHDLETNGFKSVVKL